MLSSVWDWYYGSEEEQAISDCQFGDFYNLPTDKSNSVETKKLIRKGKLSDGSNVNIFSIRSVKVSSEFENNVKFLKILRHPNILRYFNFVSTEMEAYLITETGTPLSILINELDANELCSGLQDLAHAVEFLHTQAKISHNNICVSSIYTNEKGYWKLGDFDHATSFSETTTKYLLFPENHKHLQKTEESLDEKFAFCGDVKAFGLLLKDYKKQLQFATSLSMENLDKLIADICRDDYKNRPSVKEILSMPILKSSFIFIINFLQSITLKQQAEKDAFFNRLLTMVRECKIFPRIFAKSILPLLLTPIVIAEQVALNQVIKIILKPKNKSNENGFISDEIFAELVIPKIVKLFKSRVLHVRMMLLENFHNFVHLFDKSVLENYVLPEILQGMNDCNNELVKATLVALAEAIPLVGGDIIVGTDRERLFTHATPKFNGNVLNEQTILAHQEKFPAREPLPPIVKKNKPKKPTLLELALNSKRENTMSLHNSEIIKKQQLLAHAIQRNHGKSISSDFKPVTSASTQLEKSLEIKEKTSEKIDEEQISDSKTLLDVLEKPKDLTKTDEDKKAEVETWANSSEDEDDWGTFDDSFDSEEESSTESDSSSSTDSKPHVAVDVLVDLDQPKEMNENTTSDLNTTNRLGAEFEIKALVKSKPTVEEPDYFADMEPSIPVAEIAEISNLSAKSSSVIKQQQIL